MAHFARIENNVVHQVIVINNNVLLDENGAEQESLGSVFCKNTFGGEWIQTSYSGSFRKNFAGVGYIYDPSRDAFIPPKPYESWILNEDTCLWEAPISCPSDGMHVWDEQTLQWVLV